MIALTSSVRAAVLSFDCIEYRGYMVYGVGVALSRAVVYLWDSGWEGVYWLVWLLRLAMTLDPVEAWGRGCGCGLGWRYMVHINTHTRQSSLL